MQRNYNYSNFFSKINQDKTKYLQTTVEWHTEITPWVEKQITKIHLSSFLDLYQNYSEEQLSIEETKENWLKKIIQTELTDIKKGKILLASISIENTMVGYITCLPVMYRHNQATGQEVINLWQQNQFQKRSTWQQSFRKDVYISLLAVKPIYNSRTDKKIQLGLGQQLVESVEAKFSEGNALILDTRLINTSAIAFYKRLGFSTTGKRTFSNYNPEKYVGCEKQLSQKSEYIFKL